jgi:hypothetical protein
MTSNEREQLEGFLAESFADGAMIKELRLSTEEREYLQTRYPKASLKIILNSEYTDGKTWYEVKLSKDR